MKTTLLLLALCTPLIGQVGRSPFVRAVGDGSVSVQPDQAKISLSVVTQAANAQDASGQNANLVNNVLNQLRGLLGPGADIKTTGYSLSPNYLYQQGQSPVLTGYTATNTVQVTTSDLSIVGKVIDTAVSAGANQVSRLEFGLKDDTAARSQALQIATRSAKAHADAMANGVGMHTGSVLDVQEGVLPIAAAQPQVGVASAASTPIQSGTVNVTAVVTLDIALVP